jgi:hypothetical protein
VNPLPCDGDAEPQRPILGEAAHVTATHRRGFRRVESLVRQDQMSRVGSARSDWFARDLEEHCLVRELVKLHDRSNVEKRSACERIVTRRESAVGGLREAETDIESTRL